MENERRPLLSICIPTYNRSHLLKVSLLSIMEQIKGHEDDIEVIVSNNCSTDGTEEVVRWAQQFGQIRYNKNDANIGSGPNFNFLINELALGEFCWLIGDDDFVRKDSLSRLLRVMKENPDIDLFHINGMHIDVSELEKMKDPVSSAQFSDSLITTNTLMIDRELVSFDELIDPMIDADFLCGLMCSIFRRKIWLEYSPKVEVSNDNFRDVQTTYPHAIILVMGMKGRRIFKFGNPVIVIGDGARGWESEYPMVAHIRSLELLDVFESLGVDAIQINKCRRFHLINNVPSIIFTSIRTGGHVGKYVNYNKTLLKYVTYKEFWLSFPTFVIRNLVKFVRHSGDRIVSSRLRDKMS